MKVLIVKDTGNFSSIRANLTGYTKVFEDYYDYIWKGSCARTETRLAQR